MMLGSGDGNRHGTEEDRSRGYSLELPDPSRPLSTGRRATVDSSLGLPHRERSFERRLTIDSGTAMRLRRGGTPGDRSDIDDFRIVDTPDAIYRDRNDSIESNTSSNRRSYPPRSLSLADPHQMTETEKRYLASLDERRGALDTRMLPGIGAGLKSRGDTMRSLSLPTDTEGYKSRGFSFSTNTSELRTKTPLNITRLKREDSFGAKEDLYKVDMEDGMTYVCRKRADSIINPQLMTEDERRIHEFLEGTTKLSHGSSSVRSEDQLRGNAHRIYSLGEKKLVVDPLMTKYATRSFTSRRQPREKKRERRSSLPVQLPPVILPPIFKQKQYVLRERDFSIPPGPRPSPEFTDEMWEQLRECRYLRPPPRRFQEVPEDIEEEVEGFKYF